MDSEKNYKHATVAANFKASIVGKPFFAVAKTIKYIKCSAAVRKIEIFYNIIATA